MKRIYFLSTCDTCRRLLKEFGDTSAYELIDIKINNIDGETLDFIKSKTGSYESLFSKRAVKYKSLGLKDQNLSEDDFRRLILEEYTFLKRPVRIDEESVFVGKLK